VDWRAPDRRRTFQLVLASLWLFDAVLQFQPYMFTRAFGTQMIGGSAAGNPAALAGQITWAGRAIGHHAMFSGTVFALVQLVIALGIAWRPTVKLALAASVAWALAVWWIGEGLGGILTGTASPVSGAPGAVVLYGLLAVLLWPPSVGTDDAAPFVAAGTVGPVVARGLWFVLWGSLCYFSLQGAVRAPQALHDKIRETALGQPHWLATLDNGAARLVAHRGLEFSVVLAILLAIVALGPLAGRAATRSSVVTAIAVALVIWVVGQDFGNVFSGSGTDANTGPLLILLAATFWPTTVWRPASGPATSVDPAPIEMVRVPAGPAVPAGSVGGI